MKKDKHKNRTKLVAFRVYPRELEYLRRESDEREMRISSYIRMMLLASYVPSGNNRLTSV